MSDRYTREWYREEHTRLAAQIDDLIRVQSGLLDEIKNRDARLSRLEDAARSSLSAWVLLAAAEGMNDPIQSCINELRDALTDEPDDRDDRLHRLEETHIHCEQLRGMLHNAECAIDPSVDERFGCNPEIELQAISERLREVLDEQER